MPSHPVTEAYSTRELQNSVSRGVAPGHVSWGSVPRISHGAAASAAPSNMDMSNDVCILIYARRMTNPNLIVIGPGGWSLLLQRAVVAVLQKGSFRTRVVTPFVLLSGDEILTQIFQWTILGKWRWLWNTEHNLWVFINGPRSNYNPRETHLLKHG